MALQKNLDLSHTEIDALARDRFGDPTQKLCRPHDLRFGTHGSVSVNRDRSCREVCGNSGWRNLRVSSTTRLGV